MTVPFVEFEKWKESLCQRYQENARIETISGNFLNRVDEGELSSKEKRSVVSQVVQGTGSYIFKSALIEINKEEGVEILIPMHDAVLIQHSDTYQSSTAVQIFENTMSSRLNNSIRGKASIEEFYIPKP